MKLDAAAQPVPLNRWYKRGTLAFTPIALTPVCASVIVFRHSRHAPRPYALRSARHYIAHLRQATVGHHRTQRFNLQTTAS